MWVDDYEDDDCVSWTNEGHNGEICGECDPTRHEKEPEI